MKCANSNIEVTCHFARIMRESHSCDWLTYPNELSLNTQFITKTQFSFSEKYSKKALNANEALCLENLSAWRGMFPEFVTRSFV